MPIELKSHYRELHGACIGFVTVEFVTKPEIAFQSTETGEKTAGSLFLCGIMKGKTLTLTWEVSEIEAASCLPVQPPCHSTWKAGPGFCVCFLLNDLSIGRRGS